MNSKAYILVVLAFLQGIALGIDIREETPPESAILQLPDQSESNWKEIFRHINTTDGFVEVIPIVRVVGVTPWKGKYCTLRIGAEIPYIITC